MRVIPDTKLTHRWLVARIQMFRAVHCRPRHVGVAHKQHISLRARADLVDPVLVLVPCQADRIEPGTLNVLSLQQPRSTDPINVRAWQEIGARVLDTSHAAVNAGPYYAQLPTGSGAIY